MAKICTTDQPLHTQLAQAGAAKDIHAPLWTQPYFATDSAHVLGFGTRHSVLLLEPLPVRDCLYCCCVVCYKQPTSSFITGRQMIFFSSIDKVDAAQLG